MNSALLRYNLYTGICNVGVVHVRSLEGRFHIFRVRVAWDYLRARLSGISNPRAGNGGVALPLPARNVFARMIAAKVLAWVQDDGFPKVVPTLSMQPVGDRRLVCRPDPQLGRPYRAAEWPSLWTGWVDLTMCTGGHT